MGGIFPSICIPSRGPGLWWYHKPRELWKVKRRRNQWYELPGRCGQFNANLFENMFRTYLSVLRTISLPLNYESFKRIETYVGRRAWEVVMARATRPKDARMEGMVNEWEIDSGEEGYKDRCLTWSMACYLTENGPMTYIEIELK